MLIEAYRAPNNTFHWLDVNDPTITELEHLIQTYNLHPSSVRDCLMPKHLPKYELIENNVFILLRSFDERSRNSGTVRGLTRKIAIFISENYLITVHRSDQPYIVKIRDTWVKNQKNLEASPLPRILFKIIEGLFSTYSEATYHCETSLEKFENTIFKDQSTQKSIQQKFLLKRKTSVIKHMLKMSLDLLPKLKVYFHLDVSLFKEMQELGESQYFSAEEVLENINNLINLQLSLASHQTSEVVRILTLVSVFFMPLSFIAAFYGMNFKNMPELSAQYGYPIVIGLMFLIGCILFLWFKKRKWIKSNN
ncbi:MAG TPA: CorA family divalent cation transporter [Gammaproteobacteria bacterium]|nr:CorA family divalent cation transporter [Gammaproteobacteria bacterium]